jgi:hypothetical protein
MSNIDKNNDRTHDHALRTPHLSSIIDPAITDKEQWSNPRHKCMNYTTRRGPIFIDPAMKLTKTNDRTHEQYTTPTHWSDVKLTKTSGRTHDQALHGHHYSLPAVSSEDQWSNEPIKHYSTTPRGLIHWPGNNWKMPMIDPTTSTTPPNWHTLYHHNKGTPPFPTRIKENFIE